MVLQSLFTVSLDKSESTQSSQYVPLGLVRRQVPGHISLDDDCGVPRNRDESSGVANLIILTEHRTKMHLDNIMSGNFENPTNFRILK